MEYIKKLSIKDVDKLVLLSQEEDFPCELDKTTAEKYCQGNLSCQTYGLFVDNVLVSVMTSSLCQIFPHPDNKTGNIIHISGAYTKKQFRGRYYATTILKEIEKDAINIHADYMCCDSSADELYLKCGFTKSSETRLWKQL